MRTDQFAPMAGAPTHHTVQGTPWHGHHQWTLGLAAAALVSPSLLLLATLAPWQVPTPSACQHQSERFGLRPAFNGSGACGSAGSCSKAATGTSSTRAMASSVEIVTFSSPRSTRPTYERSSSEASAKRSCDSPRCTRRDRRFQPMIERASMLLAAMRSAAAAIDGLTIPYYAAMTITAGRTDPARPQEDAV